MASVANTLCAALKNKELRELCSSLGNVSQLDELQCAVTSIKAVLLDAESKHQELTHEEGLQGIEKLKDAVYDADDLFDEFITVAQQLKAMPGGKICKKVRQFFSSKNHLNIPREIKKLREMLDGIAIDRSQDGFRDVYEPINRREETCLYVCEKSIIGREADKETIVGMLLPDFYTHQENVSFVTIVGMGGLGKTALAQLVFNDDRVKEEFGDLMKWVCVSDKFGLKKILGEMFGKKDKFEDKEKIVRSQIERKRYLLVLDDVKIENSEIWVELKELLALGERGSRVLITSRSKEVANVVGNGPIYELKGLSDDNSWELFRRMAFKQGEELEDPNLVDIGKEITKMCANVPLCIRVIGSLLYGQDKNNWLWLNSNGLAKMRQDEENSIMAALRFSYNQLGPELKSCFSFCSLFPKDYVMKNDVVVNLWLAQGYLVPSHEDQSIEDVGEEYFYVLLRRCFFHDIERDEYGEVHSFKMHDLIHDLALEVAGNEFLMLTSNTKNHLRGGIRHLSTGSSVFSKNWFSPGYCSNVRWRTIFLLYSLYKIPEDVNAILSSCKRLRVLDLHDLAIETLPNTLGKLLHLRYLDLSGNTKMKMLPTSITKLHNLQILKLCDCKKLKQLPEDMTKLVNLRMLDLDRCYSLTQMPVGMDKLKCLHTLTKFVVGGDVSSRVKKGELMDLKALVNLKGDLCIEVGEFSTKYMPNVNIIKNAHLKALEISCEDFDDCSVVHERLLECLQPNYDLSKISMVGYQGIKLPKWVSLMEASLPWLVSIMLTNLIELQHLPSLSRLCHLKNLQLLYLPKVEHLESDVLLTTFFPSLEKLILFQMPQLKGWWRDLSWVEMEVGGGCLVNDNGDDAILPSFPRLRELIVGHCKSMTYFPPCPHLKDLEVYEVNDALNFCMKEGLHIHIPSPDTSTSTASSLSSPSHDPSLCLEYLNIDNPRVFDTVFEDFVGGAVHIQIELFVQVESMGIVSKGFEKCRSSIRHLTLDSCKELTTLSGSGIEHLFHLQSLTIDHCENLDLEYLDCFGARHISLVNLSSLRLVSLSKLETLPWRFRHMSSLESLEIEWCYNLKDLGECIGSITTLRSLQVVWCQNLKALPECLKSLTGLKLLQIDNCHSLKSLPEAMRHLTSLTILKSIHASDDLVERCQKPDGEDWPKICHIPNVYVTGRT